MEKSIPPLCHGILKNTVRYGYAFTGHKQLKRDLCVSGQADSVV